MPRIQAQRGVALLALVAVLTLGISWYLVSALNTATQNATTQQAHDAQVLRQAKEALIAYVAKKAMESDEKHPGRLPCPEPLSYITLPDQEGETAGNCSLPAAGRLPWKSLGIEQLKDSAGEPLWYVVSSGWTLPYSTADLVLNSNTQGNLSVDGQANAAAALIIAPGAALAVQASANCSARAQSRSTTVLNVLDYLECQNAVPSNGTFVSTGPSGSFNDRIVSITAKDVWSVVEAVVAKRIERDISPALKSVYANTDGATKWGTSRTSASAPIYPFAAPFANPDTSTYGGVASNYRGLLPFTYSNCTPGTDPRCSTTFHAWSNTVTKTAGTAAYTPDTCIAASSPYSYQCTGWWYGSNPGNTATMKYDDRLSNVGNALRTFTFSDYVSTARYYNYQTGAWTSVTPTRTRTFNSDGSFSFVLTYTFPYVNGWGYFEFKSSRPTFSDHTLLSSTDATTGWFVDNEWHKLAYYAVAQGHTGTSTPSCTTASNCIVVANVTPSGAQRAIVILAGRSVNGSARPSATLGNYLESGNATGSFVQQTVTRVAGAEFNDRVVVVDNN